MTKETGKSFELKSKKNLMTFFLAFYMLGLSAVGISLFIEFRNFIAAIACVVLVLVGFLGLRLFLWLLFGKEKIIINDDEFILIKTGSFFLPAISIPIKEMDHFFIFYSFIEQEQGFEGFKGKVTTLSYQRPYFRILNKGRIGVKYGDKQYLFFNGLSIHQAKVLVRELNEYL